jgi:hypothetical protein
MATKKQAPSSPKSIKTKAESKGKLSLEVVTYNQRKINGRLYAALDLIVDIIEDAVPGAYRARLAEAREIIEDIPGFDPPGCGPWPD